MTPLSVDCFFAYLLFDKIQVWLSGALAEISLMKVFPKVGVLFACRLPELRVS